MLFANQKTGPAIPSTFRDYLELVDWSGRVLTAGKKAALPGNTPPILQRLRLDPNRFADYIQTRPDSLPNALGPAEALRRLARSFGLKFLRGVSGRQCELRADS
jgi:hypothetical protein